MHITLFSFVTAVLLSSLLIVALYLSRKSVKTIRMLNFGYLACLYLFCLGRIFFSVELPFAAVIRAPSLMNPLHDVNEANLPMMDGAFLVSDLLLLVWAVGSILLFAQFLIRYHRGKRDIDRLPKQENQVLKKYWMNCSGGTNAVFRFKCCVALVCPHLVELDCSDDKSFCQARNIRKKNCFISCAMSCNISRPTICWSSG